MTERLHEAISVEQLAEAMRLDRSQLYRKVKAITGKGVSRLINQIKIDRAKEMLRDSDKTVSEIAYEVGFSDPNYFMRVFSKEVGESAAKWRIKSQ